MGNTCVLKPAPDTPWNATRLGRLIAEHTDIPPGVVNIVTSSDHLVGEVISTSPSVDMVAFTGSTATGRRIMEAAAATLKPTFLELGGKSVNLVLDDADLERPPCRVASMVCMHAGQGCAMPTRLMVPRSRYDEAVECSRRPSPRSPTATHRPGEHPGPAGLEEAAGAGARLHREGQGRKAPGSWSAAACPKHLEKGFYVEPTALRRRRPG